MPAKSKAQQRYLYAHFGADWVKKHHFGKPKSDRRPRRQKKGR
jgi:hypothetical protein